MGYVARGTSPAGEGSGSAPLGDPLLATKLYAPRTRANLITRPRLIERLEDGTRGKLTLVSAAAGFGKTTLLSEWVLRSEPRVGWLSLDKEDNDPTRFFSYLVAALQTVKGDIGERTLSMLRSPQSPTRAVLTALVNEVAADPKDFALILDDYHLIENEAVHAALAFLLEHLPPQMHLVVASRTDPPLALARLLASGHLMKISASDLRFTSAEAADFLGEVMGLDLSAENVAALEERTEGWIAGIQLAALSMRGREDISRLISEFAGTDRHVFDYLAEEVLDRQPEDIRAFLLQTSILDRLSGPLCDAVTDQGGGQAKLEKLERMNLLLVSLDDQRRWYRYHHLFSGFLRERLRRSHPEVVSELHHRASAWHERNGTASEAVSHALAAGDLDRAAGMIERLADSMVGRGETPTLERLLRALPEEALRSSPRLYMRYAAFVLMPSGRWDAAEACLQDVEKVLGLGGEDITEPSTVSRIEVIEDEERAWLAGFVATARANIAYEGRGDLPSAITLNRQALELFTNEERGSARCIAAVNLSECLLDTGDLAAARVAIDGAIEISRVAGFPAKATWSLCLLGQLQTIQGRLSEAASTYERVLQLVAQHDEAVALLEMGTAHVGMGELLVEWNDLEAATRHLLEGIERVLEWVGLGEAASRLLEVTETRDRPRRLEEVDADAAHGVVPGNIALARVKQARGDTEGALEALRKVEQVAQNSRVSPLWKNRAEKWGGAWQARLRMAQGDLRTAAHWARDRGLSAEDDPDYSSELDYTTLARLLIVQGRHEEAVDLLERLLEAAEAGERGRTVIEVLILKSLALQATNDEPGALDALRRALLLAEPEGYIRTFTDEGEPLANLLRRLLKEQDREPPGVGYHVSPEYAGRLLEALGARMTTPAGVHVRGPAGSLPDPLTGRELEVLRLLASELSNREIAERLFVSLDTIKSHTRHIYAKLGVRARHQAVGRARELGIF